MIASRRNDRTYAARLNAFKAGLSGRGAVSAEDLIARAAETGCLNAADLNYPDHFADHSPHEMSAVLARHAMALNGLAMRYYTEPAFKIGAFTNPDPAIRRSAIDLTKQGLDALASMGGRLMTLWMGQDGFDYSFQADYGALWDWTLEALEEVAAHNPDLDISIEYKPNEPRAFALMPDLATTLLAIRDVNRENMGVTLDFAHVLYADEMPAFAAALASRSTRLLGVHLNDGYGKRDDGLMAATVHPVQTLELFVELERIGYDGVIYFDTFPDHGGLDPVEEARTNVALVDRLRDLASELVRDADLTAAIAQQDATRSQRIIARKLYGAG